MAWSSYGFQEISCSADEVLHHNDVHLVNERRSSRITFEELGIPRVIAVRPTIIGNVRTYQNLNTLDWVLLIGGLLSVFITFGLAIDRFIFLQPNSLDYMFAILLLYNAICYIFNTVFKEQAFEALAYALTSAVVVVYVVINYAHEEQYSANYIFKLVRLIVTLVFGSIMGLIAIIVAIQQMQSENLIFRTVGADSTIQSMCRTLFTTITLIHFDIQIVGSCIILSIEHGFTSLTLEEILCITIGFPYVFVWASLAYLTVALEENPVPVGRYCKYAAGGLGLLMHSLLLMYLLACQRNFRRGLKQKGEYILSAVVWRLCSTSCTIKSFFFQFFLQELVNRQFSDIYSAFNISILLHFWAYAVL